MYYIIHIATAFQSFKAQPREIQELIWARTLNDLRKKDPTHPLLSATLDQYLAKEAADPVALTALLKKKMALTPEFGHVIGIGRALAINGSAPKLAVAVARMIDDEKDLLQRLLAETEIVHEGARTTHLCDLERLGVHVSLPDRKINGPGR